MDNPKKVLDVSCGDNKFIFNLLKNKNCEEIIGNDISWSQIEILLNTFNNQNHIYTNHNLLNLKFKENYFDVSYCSNTLHHLQDKNSVQKALKNMFFVSRKIIVLEIEKPSNYKGLPYLLNKYYYQGFLKDVGENYLTKDEFTSIINETITDNVEIKFTNFTNIMGNYLIAEITKKD